LSILAALLGTVLLLLFFLRGNDQQRQNVAKSIAVMPFEYEGSEEDWKWLGNAVTELVNTKLAQHPTLRILDAQQRTSIMQNLGLSGSTPTLEQKLEIARKAKADNLLVGSLRKSGDRIRVEANVFETKHGTLRTALESVENNHSKLYDVANQLSDQLNNVLNIDAKTNHSAGTAAQPSLDAFRYFLEGRDAALDRRFQESIDKLTKAISLDPDYIDPYRWLAWVYRDMGDYINAKQILAKGKPHISQLSEEMRLEYLLTEAQIENRWKDYAAYLEQLLRIDPHDAVDHFRYGWTQYKKFRNLDAGIQAMEKSLELDSTYGWTYKMLGFAYLEKGDQQKALQRLEKYVALNPADVDPLDSKAEIHLYIGQYDQAIALCERILAIQPDYISTRIILTSTYIALGKYSRALDEIDRFMKLTTSPEFKSIGQSLQSEILFLQSKYNEALGSIGYAIALDSTNVEARWVRGRILLHLNDMPALNDELVAIDRALLKSGGLDGRWLLYHLQGEMALHEQKFDNAIEWFNKALDLAPPDRAFFLTALGEAYQQSGQLQLAIQNYNAALAVNPNHALAAFGLARTYEKSGKSSDAKRAYEKVVEIWSKADVQIEELEIARKKVKS
jgi:tetratricopeptide (TPR) repeat protein